MIDIKLTKTKLTDYLRVFRLILCICNKFIITNDIIEPDCISDEIYTGAHRIRHPLFTLLPGYVFESVPNIVDILNDIRDKKGIKDIHIINTEECLLIRLDYEEYILATFKEQTNSTEMFDNIVSRYISDNSHSYSKSNLTDAKFDKVFTVESSEFGSVRLSKNCFPFIGVTRAKDDVNFGGKFSLGVYNSELGENYIASYVQYKHCEAFHMYIYVPF